MTEANEQRATIGKVYDRLGEMATALAVIEAKLTERNQVTLDHEGRIRSLEKRSWSFAGLAGLIGAALSQLVSAFINR